MRYAIIGSTFSGNKGAASMLEASIQTITAKDPDAKFYVFTIYPKQDAVLNTYQNVELLSLKPLFLGLIVNPLALLHKIIVPLRPLLRKQKHVRAIAEADVFLDQAGITFVDGREKFLIYNVATMLPPLLIGTRVVKCSQAMGPFSGINRFIAKIILPHIDTICARGAITRQYLDTLGLDNVMDATDYAFLMDISEDEKRTADNLLKDNGLMIDEASKTVAVMPSEVVRKKTESSGQDYVAYNKDFINYLLGGGYRVLLMAYSARADIDTRHNNDLPVCRDIAVSIRHKNFVFIDDELSAQQLRHIISRMDMVVVSRFHAMVAALAVATPPLVVGWSHKYAEIMEMFGLQSSALDSRALDQKALQTAFEQLVGGRSQAESAIKECLPKVKENARLQVDVIIK